MSWGLGLLPHTVAEEAEAGGISEWRGSACVYSRVFPGAGKSVGERGGGARAVVNPLCASAMGSEAVCWDGGRMARPGLERGLELSGPCGDRIWPDAQSPGETLRPDPAEPSSPTTLVTPLVLVSCGRHHKAPRAG